MKVIRIILGWLSLIAACGLTQPAFAHGTGPHGGQLVDIAPYHAEFQVMPGMLHIYVIDKDDKALPIEGKVTGKLMVQLPDGTKKDVALSAMGEALMAMMDAKESESFVAVATLDVEGKSYVARYAHGNQPAGEHHDEQHEEMEHH